MKRLLISALLLTLAPVALTQEVPKVPPSHAAGNSEQIATILGLSELAGKAREMRAQATCGAPLTIEELSVRQEVLEAIVTSSFQVDGVLAELNNEQARLAEINSRLQGRRDHSVNLLNAANLITGTGLGIAVNAMQFSSSTANVGNGLGVGSGIASTALSMIGIRAQRGPQQSVGVIPNMLAPLFGRPPALNTNYPEPVMEYLRSKPAGGDRSRLDQLMNEWTQSGRIDPASSRKREQKIALLTSSMDKKTRLSIDDISDRMAMLADVAGRVALMKRDMGELMQSLRAPGTCSAPQH